MRASNIAFANLRAEMSRPSPAANPESVAFQCFPGFSCISNGLRAW